MLQKELAKRLKARYDTKMDGNEWLEVSSDGIPLCRIKYNGQFLSNADKNLSDEYRSKIADIQDEISTVREYVGLYEHAPQKILIITTAARSELLTDTMRQIRCPPFRKRFHEYIESEENPMIYLNERHRARFVLAARNVRKDNFALLSALYLLTADGRLWSCCKHHIAANTVFFEKIKLYDCSEKAYTLYCAAKDLTLGTKHITVSDLADADLVPSMLFRTICNAVAIRRFGLVAVKENCHD